MTELERLEKAIEALESQRETLGDAVVDTALAPLRAEATRLSTEAQPEQQRRLVTVLFADLAGFTSMSERMDPEDVRDVLSGYFARWKTQIEQHSGRVEKFIGDAVMAVFGLAATREDDPENAVRAALAMQGELEGLNAGWRPRNVQLAMRVGIHTGMVVVTWLADRREGEFVAVGDTVNVASRLQSVAPPGGILVSRDTFAHVRGMFEEQGLPPQAIKGRGEPVRAHLIIRARPRTFESTSRGIEGTGTRFVGRASEMQALEKAYAETWKRGAHLALITGDAGVGKSRLLLEFVRRIDRYEPGVLWLRGRAFPHTGGVPYALLRGVFASHFSVLESDSAAAAQDKFERGAEPYFGDHAEVKAHVLGTWLGYDFPSTHLSGVRDDPQQLRDRALEYFAELVNGLAFGSRLVIVLDDIHWSDCQSLVAVAHILGRAGTKFLVIAATRPSLPDIAGQLPCEGFPPDRVTRINLEPLSNEDARLLAMDILRSAPPLAEPLLSLVVRRTEGNPYFLEELLRMLGDRGNVFDVPGQADHTGNLAQIPTTLTGVLQARLDGLPPREKTVLQHASVVGRLFWRSAVEALRTPEVSEGGHETLEDTLQSLLGRHLVFRNPRSTFEGTDEFIFKHALLQETTYETVLRRDRAFLHERTARWLETAAARAGRSDEYAGVIAQHLERAGAVAAARWFLRAARHAAARFANADALRHLERAMALAADDERELRFETLLCQEDIHKVTADRPSQAEDLRRLAALAEAMEDRPRMAVVSLRSAHHAYVMADFDGALAAADAACELGRALDIAGIEGEANTMRAKVMWRRGDYTGARNAGMRALELARAGNDQSLKSNCLEALALISAHEGKYAEAMELEDEALALAKASGDVAREASALNNLGNLAWYMGNAEDALKHLLRSLELRREIGDRRGQSRVLTSLGNVECDRGELESSLRYQQASLEISRSIEDPVGTSTALANLGDQFRTIGQFEQGRTCLEEALATHRRVGNRNAECIVLGNLGLVYLSQGRFAEAEPYFVEGLTLARQLTAGHLVAHLSTYLGRIRVEQGQYDVAELLLRDALSGGEASIVPEATAGLALLHHARGDLVRAQAYADRIGALEDREIARADDPAWVMLARHEVMKACGQPGADAVAEVAWQWVQGVAARIRDLGLRTSYLEAIKSHRLAAALHEARVAGVTDADVTGHTHQGAGGSSEVGSAPVQESAQEEYHAGPGD